MNSQNRAAPRDVRRMQEMIQFVSRIAKQGDLVEALKHVTKITANYPNYGAAYELKAGIESLAGDLNASLASFNIAIKLNPENPDLFLKLGDTYRRYGNFSEATKAYEEALKINPKNPDAYLRLGGLYVAMGNKMAALNPLNQALQLNPGCSEAYNLLGVVYADLGQIEQAKQAYKESIRLSPGFAAPNNNLGNIYKTLGRFDEALACYENAIRLNPKSSDAMNNKGMVLLTLKKHDEAIRAFDQAISVKNGFYHGFNNKALAYRELKNFEEALYALTAALNIKPDYIEALNNRASLLSDLKRYPEALADFSRLIELAPKYANAHFNLANTYAKVFEYEKALVHYKKVIALEPAYKGALGKVFYTQLFLSNWDGLDAYRDLAKKLIMQGEPVAGPFELQALLDDPVILKQCAINYAKLRCPAGAVDYQISPQALPSNRIRVGYFSSDFNNHPVSHLVIGMLRQHDRSQFEIFAYQLGDKSDAWTDRVKEASDSYIDCTRMSDVQVANLARQHGLDIAVDLNGFTANCRTGIFHQRAAPIQASYIGFLGTMGAGFMDYIIADLRIIPESSRADYTEKVIYLPSFQCNESNFELTDFKITRQECGLPEDAIVLCSFNNNFKINPVIFKVWLNVLKAVPNVVLWLYVNNKDARKYLLSTAQALGVPDERIVFAEKMEYYKHFARQKLADLMLDSYPYGAGATASTALRAGLPMITLEGNSYPSRMGASLLGTLGLDELIAGNLEEYQSKIIALASSPEVLGEIRIKLAKAITKSQIFDESKFVRHLEAGYKMVVDRLHQELLPDHVIVNDKFRTGNES